MAKNPLVKRNVRLDSSNLVLVERSAHAHNRFDAIFPPNDEFGYHRIIVNGHLSPFIHPAIVSDAQTLGQSESFNLPRMGHEVVLWILRIDSTLNGVACEVNVSLAPRKISSSGYLDLGLDQVDPDDSLGHSVLHLETGVHL